MSDLNINEDAQSGGEYSGSQLSANDPPSEPIESAFPDEEEDTITMVDVLEREDELEEEASAVLGNSDEKNCTYPNGYIPRQALYSCATCSDGSDKMAAICLACSLECHDNHDVFELYTKRNYRCDCGNSKFKVGFECKLKDKQTIKAPVNEKNRYNHNFVGKYCICDKRYPPDESDESPEANDEMLQCIVCEDWYHTKHLGVKEPPTKYDELICGPCVEKLDFVHYYTNLASLETGSSGNAEQETATNRTAKTADDARDTNAVSTGSQDTPKNSSSQQDSTDSTEASTSSVDIKPITSQGIASVSESDTNDSQMENKDPSRLRVFGQQICTATTSSKPADSECVLERLKSYVLDGKPAPESDEPATSSKCSKSAIFWPSVSWRSKLCRCASCMLMYKMKECEYLLDEKDTVQYYEAQGKANAKERETPFERGMSALNRMNRTAVVEALHGYDELKADLSSYLRKFADTKKVVREEDIHDFFAQLKSKKRPRLEYE